MLGCGKRKRSLHRPTVASRPTTLLVLVLGLLSSSTTLSSTAMEAKNTNERRPGRQRRQRLSTLERSLEQSTFQAPGGLEFRRLLASSEPYHSTRLLGRATNDGDADESCTVEEECRLCSSSEKKTIDECKTTGIIQTVTCSKLKSGEDDDEEEEETGGSKKKRGRKKTKFPSGKGRTIYKSCRRSEAEEQNLVVQLQVFCLLMGVLACISARKQKVANASLFDQRKIAASKAAIGSEKRRSNEMSSGGFVEMLSTSSHTLGSTTVNMEEVVPLNDNSALDIV